MPRVVIGPALPDRASLDNEIARLRDLDVGELRSRWHNVIGLVKAAIEGRLPHGMGVVRLADLPAEWSRQHLMLGLPAQ